MVILSVLWFWAPIRLLPNNKTPASKIRLTGIKRAHAVLSNSWFHYNPQFEIFVLLINQVYFIKELFKIPQRSINRYIFMVYSILETQM